jgi:hypothetical protein
MRGTGPLASAALALAYRRGSFIVFATMADDPFTQPLSANANWRRDRKTGSSSMTKLLTG